jgi:hypothetical protein
VDLPALSAGKQEMTALERYTLELAVVLHHQPGVHLSLQTSHYVSFQV